MIALCITVVCWLLVVKPIKSQCSLLATPFRFMPSLSVIYSLAICLWTSALLSWVVWSTLSERASLAAEALGETVSTLILRSSLSCAEAAYRVLRGALESLATSLLASLLTPAVAPWTLSAT